MESSSLTSIDAIVGTGKTVVSADDGTVVAAVRDALRDGRSMTFYLSPAQAAAVKSWYWSPGQIKNRGMEPVSREERDRIKSELGIKDIGPSYSNRIECECGAQYGAFEFIEQGIREHGRETVDAVLALENTYVLRVNPVNPTVCSVCRTVVLIGHEYDMTGKYGCCRSEGTVII